MRLALAALVAAALAAVPALAQTPAPAPIPEGRIGVVTYVETNPSSAQAAIKALRAYRDATAKEAGAASVAVYREIRRPNRFVINEAWKDFASFDAHAKASTLGSAMKAADLAPPDSRMHTDWSAAPAKPAGAGAIYVFTHIDVSPPQLAGLQAILPAFIEKSRAEKGALRVDLLQALAPKRNHQTLAETWASERDFAAHQASAHAIEFRDKLGPLLGALYDQRVYALVQ